jgi:hypothetical protein
MNLTESMRKSREKGIKKWWDRQKATLEADLKAGKYPKRLAKKAQDLLKEVKRYSDTTQPAKRAYKRPNKAKPIRKMSKKREIQNREYLKLRAKFLKENPKCAIFGNPSVEVHHTFADSKRSAHFLDVSTWMAVSRAGHNYIHDKPIRAREKGWLK